VSHHSSIGLGLVGLFFGRCKNPLIALLKNSIYVAVEKFVDSYHSKKEFMQDGLVKVA
jgi:hypothetical protein